MPNIKHPELYAEILAFCEANGVSRTAFGDNAVGDPNFIRQLEGGRELRMSLMARVREHMETGITHEQRKQTQGAA